MLARKARGTAIRLDRYVVETLMADLVGHDRSTASFLVYLWLWSERSRTRGRSIERSLREIAEGTGLSKRAVQSAVARLRRRELVATDQPTITSTPTYRLLTPWRR